MDTLTVDSRVAKIKIISVIRLQDKSSSGGAYARNKNTSAGLRAKNAGGGLCARGGVFAGHYGIYIMKNPPFDSLVWGSLRLAPISSLALRHSAIKVSNVQTTCLPVFLCELCMLCHH